MANDFTGDSSCVALWKFESGALTTDTIGSNTLTDVNTVSGSSGTPGTTHMEGSCAADFESTNSERFSIADASIDAGFPFKSSDTTLLGSFCFWCKLESYPASANMALISKHASVTNKRCIYLGYSSSGVLSVYWGYNSGVSAEQWTGFYTLSTGKFYHIGLVVNAPTRTVTITIYDNTLSNESTYSHTFSNTMSLTTAAFCVGAKDDTTPECYDGIIDELVVFNRLLDTNEIGNIRSGSFPVVGMPDIGMPMPALAMTTPTPCNFETLVYPVASLSMTGRPTVHGNLTNLEYPITFPLPDLSIVGAQVGQISSAGFMLPDVVMNAGSKVATMGVPFPALAITAKAAVTSSGTCSVPLPELAVSTTMGVTGSFAGGVPLGVLDADDGDNFSGSMSLNFPLPSCSITPAQSNAYSLRYARGSTCY